MKCIECGGTIKKVKGSLPFKSRIIGEVLVPNIHYEKCSNCNEITVLLDDSDQITGYVEKLEQGAISRLPIGDFITLDEAADILEISKQAFSKNPRIRRGLIMSYAMAGRKYYLKKSVLQFKEKKNGLFKLPMYVESYEYVESTKTVTTSDTGQIGVIDIESSIHKWGQVIDNNIH